MLKIGLAIFLIAHGLVHSILAVAPNPGDPDAKPGAFFTAVERSWLLPQLGLNAATVRWTGIILVALSTLGFVLAGLGVLGVAGLGTIWQTVSVLYLVFSLALGSGVVYHGRTFSRAEMATINLPRTIFVNSLALLLYGLLIVNLAFLPKPGFALYYLALLAGMTAMFVTFADVATRDDE